MHEEKDELRALHEALRKSEERFRKIFEHSNDGMFVIDPSTDRILDVNHQACRMLGYTREELLALPISAVHPHEVETLVEFARGVVEKGSGWTDELSCMTKRGSALPSEISAAVAEIDGRRCVVAAVRDISQRVRDRDALRQYSENLERLVEERTEQLRLSERRSRLLLDINNAIIANLDRESLFDAIAEALRKVIPFQRASLSVHDPERDVIAVQSLGGQTKDQWVLPVGSELPGEGSWARAVLHDKRPVILRDLKEEPDVYPKEELVAEGIRAVVIVPLVAKGRAIGTLEVGSGRTGEYAEGDAELLLEVAGQIGLAMENMLAYEKIAELKARLEQENIYLQEEIKTHHAFGEIVGGCPETRRVLKAVETVAPTEATVLITGETGTGKELVAEAVHALSERRSATLVKVNCAALPSGLIESELFGHERGAFTGALNRKIGRFELADGGTIFLDEIGDLTLDLQAKLLRVLQDGEFQRVGGSDTIKVDVRVIAATNKDLDEAIGQGSFRPDLYYRLNVFPISIPPLRERKADIPLLVSHFAMKHALKLGKKIDTIPEAKMRGLLDYEWPGNVRELENVIERAVIVSDGPELNLADWTGDEPSQPGRRGFETLSEFERDYIIRVLNHTDWIVSGERGAAKILGLKPTTLEARMRKLGIDRPRRQRLAESRAKVDVR